MSTMMEFDKLKERMNTLTETLDMYLDDKLGVIQELSRSYRDSVEQLNTKSKELEESIQSTQSQLEEMEQQIRILESENDTSKTNLALIQVKWSQLQANREVLLKETKDIDTLLLERQDKIAKLKEFILKQNHQDNPEVNIYEKIMGLKIDTSEKGSLRFNFKYLTETKSTIPSYVVLDVSREQYHILSSQPEINPTALNYILTELNNTNNITQFLISIRDQLLLSLAQID